MIRSDKVGKLLWSGQWSKDESITVDGLSDYTLFVVYIYGAATPLIGTSSPNANYFRCFGGYANTTPNFFVYSLNANRSGNTLTAVQIARMNVAGTSITEDSIGSIYGII